MHLFLPQGCVRPAGRAFLRCAPVARRAPGRRLTGILLLALGALLCAGTRPAAAQGKVIGESGTPTTWEYPLNTAVSAARTLSVYLQNEIGRGGEIVALELNVTELPAPLSGQFEIQMDHTEMNVPIWPDDDTGDPWPLVYSGNISVSQTGWLRFDFTTPFTYDGVRNLLIGFALENNTTSTPAATCAASGLGTERTLYATVMEEGGGWPGPEGTNLQPVVRLVFRPQIEKVVPQAAPNTGPQEVTVTGAHFYEGATLHMYLEGDESSKITATNVTVSPDNTQITGTFDLLGKTEGIYNIVVDYPGTNDSGELKNAFAVGEPLAAAVGRLRATRAPSGKVTVEWTPEEGSDVAGYHVLRAARLEGPFTRVTPRLIPPGSRTCRFVDGGARGRAGQYYCLEVRHTSGRVQRLAPVSVSAPAASSRGKRGK